MSTPTPTPLVDEQYANFSDDEVAMITGARGRQHKPDAACYDRMLFVIAQRNTLKEPQEVKPSSSTENDPFAFLSADEVEFITMGKGREYNGPCCDPRFQYLMMKKMSQGEFRGPMQIALGRNSHNIIATGDSVVVIGRSSKRRTV